MLPTSIDTVAFVFAKDSGLLQGTLELLVLKTLSWGPMHGYGIAAHIQQISADVLQVEEGSLYPALQRMQLKGWVTSDWAMTPTNRRARYYKLTAAGRKRLGVSRLFRRIFPNLLNRSRSDRGARERHDGYAGCRCWIDQAGSGPQQVPTERDKPNDFAVIVRRLLRDSQRAVGLNLPSIQEALRLQIDIFDQLIRDALLGSGPLVGRAFGPLHIPFKGGASLCIIHCGFAGHERNVL